MCHADDVVCINEAAEVTFLRKCDFVCALSKFRWYIVQSKSFKNLFFCFEINFLPFFQNFAASKFESFSFCFLFHQSEMCSCSSVLNHAKSKARYWKNLGCYTVR